MSVTNAFTDDPARQCHGKVRHESKARAKAEIRKLGQSRALRAYRCPHCGAFHTGRRP